MQAAKVQAEKCKQELFPLGKSHEASLRWLFIGALKICIISAAKKWGGYTQQKYILAKELM